MNVTTKGQLRRIGGFLGIVWLLTAAAPAAAVTIQKFTNGQDANAPPGPVLVVGSTVNWTYVVTAGNTDTSDLSDIVVSDNQPGVVVSCPSTTLLAGESMTCTASGTVVAGQYANIGTVSATEGGEAGVQASDPSHYFGQAAGLITLVKATNGFDANTPPGPVVSVGSAIAWTYVVTNTSAVTITGVGVTDDQGVTVSCPATTLIAGASMTCTASGTAVAGQYGNIGTATATHPNAGTIIASDPSHYFGVALDSTFDFGDAPDSYATTLAANGARHVLGSDVYLGACVDAELDGQPTAGANGDDAVGTLTVGTCVVAGQDDDGVAFTSPLRAGQTASITVVASGSCTLSAWMDFNQNGNWSDAEDNLFPGGIVLSAGANALSFVVPSNALAGPTYARFRCTTDGTVSFTGPARDGEVEDYQVTILPPAPIVGVPALRVWSLLGVLLVLGVLGLVAAKRRTVNATGKSGRA